jgi:hypothetical protein
MKRIISQICLLLTLTLVGSAQESKINWNVVSDSISLTPKKFESDGTFTLKYSSNTSPIQIVGKFALYPNNKIIHFNEGENLFKFSNYSDIIGINLNSFKYFSNEDLNSKDLYDTLLQVYRRNLFPQLNLTEIEIQLSKRNKFEIVNNELKVKKPLILKGKICEIELSHVVILTEEGDLFKIYDGDFNFLKVGEIKAFECTKIYDYFYERYQRKLEEIILDWETKNRLRNIEFFIENYGPFDNQYKISNDKTVYIWNKKSVKYYINMNSTRYSTGISYGSFYRNKNYSPLFYYNYQANTKYQPSFISTNSDLVGNSNSVSSSTTQSMQNGEVSSSEESTNITLIFESSGKLIQSYQEKLFASPEYGQRFRFINLF